jgi:nucleoid-associated protein YgaU
MALQNKYSQLINSAKAEGVQNLEVREQNGVLYIDGTAPSTAVKDKLWQVYNTIDPDYKAGDLVLNIEATDSGSGAEQEYEVVSGDTLTGIGKKLGKNWKEIFEANRDKIKDPDMIQTGWKLKIPA